MKPKTKLQIRVAELSKKLPKITKTEEEWAKSHCFEPTGYLRSKSVWCLECGHTFIPRTGQLSILILQIKCPHCARELKLKTSKKRKYDHKEYYSIITVSGKFQVLRHFIVSKFCTVGNPAFFTINEAIQNWITPTGQCVNVSRNAKWSIYYDLWDWSSAMEIRGKSNLEQKYNVFSNFIYPKMKYTPTLKRNGFKGYFHGISPIKLFVALLSNSKMETLMKAAQYKLLKYFVYHHRSDFALNKSWQPIKICLRNNYQPKDIKIWLDYIDLLQYFGKDLCNAKYVCPADLTCEHDRYVRKKQILIDKQRAEEKLKKATEENKQFLKLKSKYIGIAFSDGKITIKVLEDVFEYISEGNALNHCVHTNDYHLKKDTLILSARVDDVPVETIEISLNDFNIIQCRGKNNKNTKYHKQIMELVNKNAHLFKTRKTKRKTIKHNRVAV